jgi:hypothetical protein
MRAGDRPWDEADVAHLHRVWTVERQSLGACAAALNRSRSAINQKLARLRSEQGVERWPHWIRPNTAAKRPQPPRRAGMITLAPLRSLAGVWLLAAALDTTPPQPLQFVWPRVEFPDQASCALTGAMLPRPSHYLCYERTEP